MESLARDVVGNGLAFALLLYAFRLLTHGSGELHLTTKVLERLPPLGAGLVD